MSLTKNKSTTANNALLKGHVGKEFAAHAHGADRIKRTIIAEANSIDQGSIMDAETLQLMKQKKPTMFLTFMKETM